MPPYVAEMPLAGFKTAELFLLTTLRLWLAAHRRAGGHPAGLAAVQTAALADALRPQLDWRYGCSKVNSAG